MFSEHWLVIQCFPPSSVVDKVTWVVLPPCIAALAFDRHVVKIPRGLTAALIARECALNWSMFVTLHSKYSSLLPDRQSHRGGYAQRQQTKGLQIVMRFLGPRCDFFVRISSGHKLLSCILLKCPRGKH